MEALRGGRLTTAARGDSLNLLRGPNSPRVAEHFFCSGGLRPPKSAATPKAFGVEILERRIAAAMLVFNERP